ncbi:peroxiredoxin [Kozakia baliensis]|uniref:peroxiredoxin n=1 Tax=Kozakia baliensis TaxID=153496 RepID=UPI00087926EF|nr:peroxiredoxin [Kozakia baliensis]AOX18960.1 peroxiredoxin [Kozakia baliensis]
MDDNSLPQTASNVKIGSLAPDFTARTTRGPLTLSALRGRWVVLFSHPADFTPVCTSEFLAFAQAQPQFEALNCALVGLSIDSLPSHIAWLEAIRRAFGVRVDFPLIEDPSMAIARAYGMLDDSNQDSGTVRATFIIAPDGIIQAILWYPLSIGRSVNEILRSVAALQRASQGDALTPEGWQPGEDVLCPLAACQADIAENEETWFHVLKKDRSV